MNNADWDDGIDQKLVSIFEGASISGISELAERIIKRAGGGAGGKKFTGLQGKIK